MPRRPSDANQLRRRIAAFDTKVVNLEDLLQKQLRLVDEALDQAKRTVLVPGAELTPADAKRLADLSRAVVSLVDADVRHQKAIRARGAELSPEEEDDALVQMVLELTPDRRARVLTALGLPVAVE